MQLTLRCTNVMEHPNNTQSVSLQEPPAHVPGAPGPRALEGMLVTETRVAPVRIPLPAPRGPVSVLLTNISSEQKFEVGKSYQVSIS